MAAVAHQRSPTKFAPADWHTANFVIASSSERQRAVAHDVRQQSQRLRNDTENKTRWTQHSTDTKLDQRIGDIHSWRNTLERTLQDTETEINKMTEHKERTEFALEAKTMPLDVVMECLSLREQRVSTDLVRDEVEEELHKELEVVERTRGLLHQKVNQAFEQICVLQECHGQLHADLTDKYAALEIDTESAELTNTTDTITLHVDPTRIKKGIVTPVQWRSFSAHNTQHAQDEMRVSVQLREAINHTLQRTTADLEAQWRATNYAFRKRLHEMEQTRQELEWQRKNTEAEIKQVEEEIAGLDRSLADKLPPMMVVQTRLENRTFRPNVELCRDEPQYGMVEEVAEIAESQHALQEKRAVAEYSLGSLQRTLERINCDLAVKENSLTLDNQCIQTRERLAEHPKAQELTQPLNKTEK